MLKFLSIITKEHGILNYKLFCKRIEYTGVAFYPVSIPECNLYFGREGSGVKNLLSYGEMLLINIQVWIGVNDNIGEGCVTQDELEKYYIYG